MVRPPARLSIPHQAVARLAQNPGPAVQGEGEGPRWDGGHARGLPPSCFFFFCRSRPRLALTCQRHLGRRHPFQDGVNAYVQQVQPGKLGIGRGMEEPALEGLWRRGGGGGVGVELRCRLASVGIFSRFFDPAGTLVAPARRRLGTPIPPAAPPIGTAKARPAILTKKLTGTLTARTEASAYSFLYRGCCAEPGEPMGWASPPAARPPPAAGSLGWSMGAQCGDRPGRAGEWGGAGSGARPAGRRRHGVGCANNAGVKAVASVQLRAPSTPLARRATFPPPSPSHPPAPLCRAPAPAPPGRPVVVAGTPPPPPNKPLL